MGRQNGRECDSEKPIARQNSLAQAVKSELWREIVTMRIVRGIPFLKPHAQRQGGEELFRSIFACLLFVSLQQGLLRLNLGFILRFQHDSPYLHVVFRASQLLDNQVLVIGGQGLLTAAVSNCLTSFNGSKRVL